MKVWVIDKNREVKCHVPGAPGNVSNYFYTDIHCVCNSCKIQAGDKDPEIIKKYIVQYDAICVNCGAHRGKLYIEAFTRD